MSDKPDLRERLKRFHEIWAKGGSWTLLGDTALVAELSRTPTLLADCEAEIERQKKQIAELMTLNRVVDKCHEEIERLTRDLRDCTTLHMKRNAELAEQENEIADLRRQVEEAKQPASQAASMETYRYQMKELKRQLEERDARTSILEQAILGLLELFGNYGFADESPCDRDREIIEVATAAVEGRPVVPTDLSRYQSEIAALTESLKEQQSFNEHWAAEDEAPWSW